MEPTIIDPPPAKEPSSQPVNDAQNRRDRWQRQLATSMTVTAVLVSLAVIYFSRAILFPIALAVLLNLVFKPIVVRAERFHIPSAWSAAVIMAILVALLVVGIYVLWAPASAWVADLPNIRNQLSDKLQPLQQRFKKLSEASDEVERMTEMDDDEAPIRVKVEQPDIMNFVFNTSGSLLATIGLTVTLLYFLLASGDNFLEKVVSLAPTWKEKRSVVELTHAIQRSISTYLFTITLVNAGLGICIGLAMWWLELPTPALWGFMAFLLNYIPFVGAAVGTCIVFIIALLEHDLAFAALAPLAYVLINSIEANFVTPAMLGRSTSMNPVAILISLTIWGWMWGLGGVFLAVPILVTFKIICEYVQSLSPISRLLES